MADNSNRTSSGSEAIRTLERSGPVKTQIMGVDVAQSGDSELLGLGDSRVVTGTSAGLTTATTAYVAGDQLGTEITLSNMTRTGKGCTIVSATLIDKAKVLASVDAFLFSAATTPAADNAANSWSDADMLNCLGILHFADLVQSGNNYILQALNCPITVKPGSSTSIFCDLVTRSGHTFFGAVGDIQITLGILRD